MGQKVSPVGLRIGINKVWEAKWYANKKEVSKYLSNDIKIRKFLLNKYKMLEYQKSLSKERKTDVKYIFMLLSLV